MKRKNIFFILPLCASLASCNQEKTDYDATGVFEATEVIVSAKSAGEIQSLNIEEGAEVKEGSTLGKIDATQLELKKNQFNASTKQLEAGKQQAAATKRATQSKQLDLEKQIASLRQQIKNQQSEKSRFEALLKDGAATQKQVDDITYQISVLQKQLAATQEQLSSNNSSLADQSQSYDAQISGLEAQKEGISAQQAQLDDQIGNTIIKTPISGTILTKYAEAGEFAAAGKPLFKVADISNLILRVYVTADQLTKLKLGQKVTVYTDYEKDGRKQHEGTISWISNKAEFTPKTIQTRDERANLVYAVKISVKNDGLIKIGMYGDVKF